MRTLKEINADYEKVLQSDLSSEEKTKKYVELMNELEQTYKIPALKDETYERENKKVVALYRKISMSREL
jgi:hypothetical protein